MDYPPHRATTRESKGSPFGKMMGHDSPALVFDSMNHANVLWSTHLSPTAQNDLFKTVKRSNGRGTHEPLHWGGTLKP